MKIKERIENNLVWWSLSLLIVGFLAGITAYRTILEIANQITVTKGSFITIEELNEKYILREESSQTPITSNEDNYYNLQCFNLGYDYSILFGLAWGYSTENQEELKVAFLNLLPMVQQRIELLNLNISIDKSFLYQTTEEVIITKKRVQSEIISKIQAINPKYYIPFRYGRWLGNALISVAVAQGRREKDIFNLLNPTIQEFENKLRNFEKFHISENAKKGFLEINNELKILIRGNNITASDYSNFSKKVLNIVTIIGNEFD